MNTLELIYVIGIPIVYLIVFVICIVWAIEDYKANDLRFKDQGMSIIIMPVIIALCWPLALTLLGFFFIKDVLL